MLFFLPIAIGFLRLLQLYAKKKMMKLVVSAFIILLLIGLGHGTFVRNFDWKNEETLWGDAAAKAPRHHRPHHNLGRYYQDHGYTRKAISAYRKALESPFLHQKNQAFVTYYNLGKIYAELGDYEKALSLFYKSLRMAPDFPSVHNDIAVVFDRKGNYHVAHRYFLSAIRLEPDSPETNQNLGLYYLQ
jgi:tetratricopeptide (TPR) repeat protein